MTRRPVPRAALVLIVVLGAVAATLLLIFGWNAGPGAVPAVGSCEFGPAYVDARNGYTVRWEPVEAVDEEAPAGESGPVGGYLVETRAAGSSSWEPRHTTGPGTTSWFDAQPDAAGATGMEYRLRSRDASGRFGPYTGCVLVADAPPSIPTGIAVSKVTDTSVRLTWRASDDDVGVVDYVAYVDDDGLAPNNDSEAEVGVTRKTGLTISGLDPGSTTYVYLRARDAEQASSRTRYVAITTTGGCTATSGTATGRWHTEQICDVWQILDPAGSVTQLRAVNVRGSQLAVHPLDRSDVANLAGVFDTVRLTLPWDKLQPSSRDELSAEWVSRVRNLLEAFEAQGVGVILDVAHLGGAKSGDTAFSIPSWAWEAAGVATADRRPDTSFPAWAGPDNAGGNLASYLDALDAVSLLTHPAVIAVEVVNEPFPPATTVGATSESAQRDLAEVYDALITRIRSQDPGMMVVIGAYHGGTRHGGDRVDGRFAFNDAATVIDAPNVVWTAHTYFTGVGDDDGQLDNGARDAGTWAENTDSGGCYGDPEQTDRSVAWRCPTTPRRRAQARAGIALNARGHWDYAQEAGMPFLMGEWGLPRQRFQGSQYVGWDLSEYLFCDKLAAYDDVDGAGHAISWAVWSFDADNDAFGLYNGRDQPDQRQVQRSYLAPNGWADAGTFGSESGAWDGLAWTYAEPFTDPSFCAGL